MAKVARRPALARTGVRDRQRPPRVVLNENAGPGLLARLLRRVAREGLRATNWLVPKRADACLLAGIPDTEDGVLALSAALIDDGREVTALVVHAVPPGFFDPRVRLLRRGSVRGLWAYLRCAHVIVTHGLYDNVIRPDRQVLVYLWHGESPNKKLDAYLGSAARPHGHAPVLSTIGQAFRCAEFGLPPTTVPPIGAPRNDRMLTATPAPARKAIGADDGVHLLWMPTYRAARVGDLARRDSAAGYAGLPFAEDELLELDAWLERTGATVHVKLHPVEAGSYRLDTCRIRPLRQDTLTAVGLSTYTVLPAFDGLITDVSSIWVDYLLLDRPIVFAFPDVEEYRARRGFEVEPYEEWVPGRLGRTLDDLTADIADVVAGRDPFRARRATSRRLLHRYDDARSARRVTEYLFPRSRPAESVGTKTSP